MIQKNIVRFEIEKNGRVYTFSCVDQSPIADAFDAAKDFMVGFSNAHEHAKAQEAQQAEAVVVQPQPDLMNPTVE